jgi:3alpha(or 20beta)-hydroxysteroid dehydrogenase
MAEKGKLDGRVVLLTGGAGGIGGAEARLFADEGASVVIGDVDREKGAETAAEIGDAALFVPLDISRAEDWDAAVAASVERFGRLDGLVNNAGVYSDANLADTTPELWDRIMAVNARGTYLGMRAMIAPLEAAGGGSIVNIASAAGLKGFEFMFAYGVSKWAMRGITRYAAREFAPQGIRVNAILPGVIDTPMQAGNSEETLRELERMTPLGRMGEPAEIAAGALFLTADDGSFVSGLEMVIDGGVFA